MDDDDFQRTYHDYWTADRAEAEREAASITLADGSHPVAVGLAFGQGVRYCLMLPGAAGFLGELYPDRGID